MVLADANVDVDVDPAACMGFSMGIVKSPPACTLQLLLSLYTSPISTIAPALSSLSASPLCCSPRAEEGCRVTSVSVLFKLLSTSPRTVMVTSSMITITTPKMMFMANKASAWAASAAYSGLSLSLLLSPPLYSARYEISQMTVMSVWHSLMAMDAFMKRIEG